MKLIKFALVLCLAGHAVAGDSIQPTVIEGLTLLGSPATAKSMGFTKCENNYNYYLCSRTKATRFFGTTPSKVEILINGKDNYLPEESTSNGPTLSEVSPDKLSYRGVRMQYDLEEREKLTAFLLNNGWLKSGSLNNTEYFKSGINASIKIQKFSVTLRPQEESEVEKTVSALTDSSEVKKTSEDQSASFIDSMKE
jgi:hypothetical protein